MALIRRNIHCQACDYQGAARMTWFGGLLWGLAVLFVFFSFIFWPLFLVWPILIVLLLIFPLGQVCPACSNPISRANVGGYRRTP